MIDFPGDYPWVRRPPVASTSSGDFPIRLDHRQRDGARGGTVLPHFSRENCGFGLHKVLTILHHPGPSGRQVPVGIEQSLRRKSRLAILF
ncbi:MAG: hypothetical protein ACSHW1_01385 [Yoonia sp.]